MQSQNWTFNLDYHIELLCFSFGLKARVVLKKIIEESRVNQEIIRD